MGTREKINERFAHIQARKRRRGAAKGVLESFHASTLHFQRGFRFCDEVCAKHTKKCTEEKNESFFSSRATRQRYEFQRGAIKNVNLIKKKKNLLLKHTRKTILEHLANFLLGAL